EGWKRIGWGGAGGMRRLGDEGGEQMVVGAAVDRGAGADTLVVEVAPARLDLDHGVATHDAHRRRISSDAQERTPGPAVGSLLDVDPLAAQGEQRAQLRRHTAPVRSDPAAGAADFGLADEVIVVEPADVRFAVRPAERPGQGQVFGRTPAGGKRGPPFEAISRERSLELCGTPVQRAMSQRCPSPAEIGRASRRGTGPSAEDGTSVTQEQSKIVVSCKYESTGLS